jgi:hypothetical protein
MRAKEDSEDVVDEDGKVCSMIQIETTPKLLIRFAAASVLRDDDARNGF